MNLEDYLPENVEFDIHEDNSNMPAILGEFDSFEDAYQFLKKNLKAFFQYPITVQRFA